MTIELAEILFYILITSFSIQIFYFLFFYLRLSFHKNIKINSKLPISVIIAARNEETNLKEFLPLILNQDYPNFEVIVVNDRSWDKSSIVLKHLQEKYDMLKIVENPDLGKDGFAKKMALTLGIKAAKYDNLLFTDADCKPSSPLWISKMADGFNNKDIVLGAGMYIKTRSILNKFIRFDTVLIALQYLTMAKAKIPYMGIGRNLAYKKNVYEKIRGYKNHYHIPSGDDDLFVNQTADTKNTNIIFCKDSITLSTAKETFKDWLIQKRRHNLTGTYYRLYQQFLLILYPLTLVVFYTSLILFASYNLKITLYLLAFRSILQILIFIKPFIIMSCRDLLILASVYEILLILLYPLFHIKKHKI